MITFFHVIKKFNKNLLLPISTISFLVLVCLLGMLDRQKIAPTHSTMPQGNLITILREIPVSERLEMLEAGQRLLTNQNIVNMLAEMRDGDQIMKKKRHYPQENFYDTKSSSGYFFHKHRKGEMGHFHLFLGQEPFAISQNHQEPKNFTHMIGISLDERGNVKELFTVNQWVTNEKWRSAADIYEAVLNFALDREGAFPTVNQWLSDTVRIFRPQIIFLLQERDKILELQANKGFRNVLRDRRLETINRSIVSVSEQLRLIHVSLSL